MTTSNNNSKEMSAIDGFDYWLDKQISHFNPNAPSGKLVIEWLQKAKKQYQNVKEDYQTEKQAAIKAFAENVKDYIDQQYDLCAELYTYEGGKEDAAYDIYNFIQSLLSDLSKGASSQKASSVASEGIEK
jgi:hypothetical protein